MSLITRGTRSDSYKAVKESKATRQNQIVIEMTINGNKGMTAKELAEKLYDKGLVKNKDRNQTHPRLNELVKAGRVRVTGKKKDVETNRKVAVYEVVE